MTAEVVNFVLNRFLKPFHDQKGNDRSGQSYGDTDDGDGMNDRGKTLLLTPGYPLRYEIGYIQFGYLLIWNVFCKIEITFNSDFDLQ